MAKDDNGTIKFLLYVLIFLVIILLLLLLFIIPGIKAYKQSSTNLKNIKEKSLHLQKKELSVKERLEAFKDSKSKLNKKADTPFDLNDFKQYAQKFLKDVKIIKTQNEDTNFEEYNVSASTATKSPKSFFDFIDALNKYNSVVKINFPIELISKDNKIDLKFNVNIYKNSEKN
ncbi:MAG: hypothetical protein DSZ06_04505 [Sulfurospirillum sp.]|nr:MAG: hypothetical protein DSZ06_04505 [Sulfurospirillum sp.]